MNLSILIGRLVEDPELRYSDPANNSSAVARFTLAVNRRKNKNGEQEADFIHCVCFGAVAEFVSKYFEKGQRTAVSGSIRTGSYVNKDGIKIPTFDLICSNVEFADGKKENKESSNLSAGNFVNIPEGLTEEGLPFN